MSEYRWPFFAGLTVGSTLMAFGLVGALRAFSRGELLGWGAWIVGIDVGHDFLLVPIVVTIGAVVVAVVPRPARAPVQAGLIASGVVVVIGWLPLRSTAAATGNPTIQPLDYSTAIGWVLGGVWLVCGTWAIARAARSRSRARR